MSESYPFATLPDLLAPDMALAFVGINPSTYSVERGHYFARRTNRFWPAFSHSRLSAPARATLGVETLGPEHDANLLRFGIGFTDVIKRPSSNAGSLTAQDFEEWVPRLAARLRHYRVRVACFHGLTGYRPFARLALRLDEPAVKAVARAPQVQERGGIRTPRDPAWPPKIAARCHAFGAATEYAGSGPRAVVPAAPSQLHIALPRSWLPAARPALAKSAFLPNELPFTDHHRVNGAPKWRRSALNITPNAGPEAERAADGGKVPPAPGGSVAPVPCNQLLETEIASQTATTPTSCSLSHAST